MRLVIGKQYAVKTDRETYMQECRKRYEERNAEERKQRKHQWYVEHRDLTLRRTAENKRQRKNEARDNQMPEMRATQNPLYTCERSLLALTSHDRGKAKATRTIVFG